MKRRPLLGFPVIFASALVGIGRPKAQTAQVMTRDVITRVPAGDGNGLPSFQEMETITLKIRNYRPEDAARFTYYLAEVRENGSGWSSVWPDNEGVLSRTRAKRPEDVSSQPTQHYYFTVDNVTGEKLYTFDFQDISLVSLVRSLNGSLRTGARGEGPGGPFRPPEIMNDPAAEDIVIPAIQGDHITLAETLDRVREAVGCDVIQVEGGLTIDWCG